MTLSHDIQTKSNGAGGSRGVAARLDDSHGFTLVESIVSLLVVGIVLSAVAYVLVFGTNMTNNQEATTNAQTLAATVKSNLEATLQDAQSATVDDDGTIHFVTGSDTDYLGNKGSEYTLSVKDGHVQIANAAGDSGDFIPASTYINDDTVDVKRASSVTGSDGKPIGSDQQLAVTVYHGSNQLAQVTTAEIVSPAALADNGGAA